MPKNLLTRIILSGVRCCSPMRINFDVFGSSGGKTVRGAENVELNSKNQRPAVKYDGGSVMVLGRVATSRLSSLIFIDGISDKVKYVKISKQIERKTNEISQEIITFNRTTIRNVWLKLLKNGYCTTLHGYTSPHPPQSSNLNPIEYLRDEVERGLRIMRKLRRKTNQSKQSDYGNS